MHVPEPMIPSGESPPLEPAPPAAFADPIEEADFRATQQLLLSPAPSRKKATLLLISLAAFAVFWLVQGSGSLADLAILVGVLIVHELGHAAGMRAFGYQDVRVFFIPLFGAAAAGRPRGVSRGKQAIVLLLGPLPGIIAGCVLARVDGPPWLHTTAILLLYVNALNLLPVEPLDGGQLFQVLAFSRNRHLELVFRGVTAAVVVVASLYFRFWVLAAVGYLLLVGLPHTARLLAGAAKLRPLGWPDDPAALDEAQQRTLFRAAWDSLPDNWRARWRGKARAQADMMEQMLTRATERPPSVLASLGVFALWLAGAALVVSGSIAAVNSPPHWRHHDNPAAAFSIDLPGPVQAHAESRTGPGGADGIATATWHGARYDVLWFVVASSTDWLQATRRRMVGREDLVRDAMLPDDEYLLRDPSGKNLHTKLVSGNNGFGYILIVTPADAPYARRVLNSFEAHANPRP